MSQRVRCTLCKEVLTYSGAEDTGVLIAHVNEKHPKIQVSRVGDRHTDSYLMSVEHMIRLDEMDTAKSDEPNSVPPTPNSTKKTPKNSDRNIRNVAHDAFRSNFEQREFSPQSPTTTVSNAALVENYLAKCVDADQRENVRQPWPIEDTAAAALLKDHKAAESTAAANTTQKPVRNSYRTAIESWRPGQTSVHCERCGRIGLPTVRRVSERAARNPMGAACMLAMWPLCFLPCWFPAPAMESVHCGRCGWRLGIYDGRTGRTTATAAPVQKKAKLTEMGGNGDFTKMERKEKKL